jgi:hypothetical protein
MSGSSQALVLRFGADTAQMRGALSALASEAPRLLGQVAQASISSSRVLRESLVTAGAEGTKAVSAQLISLAKDTDNLKLVSQLAGEGIKTAFAINHPILAIGLRLLGEYKVALGLVAVGAITAHEALAIMSAQFEEINHIIAGAEKAGVSPTLFQAWTDQAVHLRLTVQEMEQAIIHAGQTLERQLNPIQQNEGGSLSKSATFLSNYLGRDTASKEAVDNARSVEELHRAALLLVQDYQRASEELKSQGLDLESQQRAIEANRIATEVWGEAGRKVAEGIKDGSLKVDDFIRSSEAAGHVWSNEIVAAQRDVNKELDEARKHLSDEMKPAFEIIEKLTLAILSGWARIVDRIATAAGDASALAGALGGLLSGAATQELKDMAAANADPSGGVPFRQAFSRHLTVTRFPSDAPVPPARPAGLGERTHAGRGSASETADEVERYIRSLEKENASLQGEAAALGKSNTERQKSIDLAKAEEAAKERGTPLSEEERQKVLRLAEAHAVLKQKIDDAAKAKEKMQASQKFFGETGESAIEKLIVDHQKFADVLRDVVKELERAALKALLLGEGPLGGLFGAAAKGGALGGIFGAIGKLFPFADGGMVTLAHMPSYAVGGAVAPDGGFPILAHPGEIVLNAAQQQNVASAIAGPNVQVKNYAAGVQVTPQISAGRVNLLVWHAIKENNVMLPGILAAADKRSS